MLTDGPLRGLVELREEMGHGLVEVVLGEGLGVVHSEGGDESDDHLANVGVPVRLEVEDLLGSVEEILFHELESYRVSVARTEP